SFLQLTHFSRQRRLVSHGTRHASQKRRNLRAGLREPENVIDKQKHVAPTKITEVFSDGQARKSHTSTRARRLVHLAKYERQVAFLYLLEVDQVEIPVPLLHRFHEGLAVLDDSALQHLTE